MKSDCQLQLGYGVHHTETLIGQESQEGGEGGRCHLAAWHWGREESMPLLTPGGNGLQQGVLVSHQASAGHKDFVSVPYMSSSDVVGLGWPHDCWAVLQVLTLYEAFSDTLQ